MGSTWEGWLGFKPTSGMFSTTHMYFASVSPFRGGSGVDICLYQDEKKTTIKQAIHVPLSPPPLLEADGSKSLKLTVAGGRVYVLKCRSAEELAACMDSWRVALCNTSVRFFCV